jgi:hypothetical protein
LVATGFSRDRTAINDFKHLCQVWSRWSRWSRRFSPAQPEEKVDRLVALVAFSHAYIGM